MARRVCFALDLIADADLIADYERAHAAGAVWPDVTDAIRAKGVDSIVCMAVNDAFVMGAWGTGLGATGKVTMLADGNGELTRALGLEMDASGAGLGLRSQRFAMVVDDGKVTTLAVEEPMKFDVSSADSILAAL